MKNIDPKYEVIYSDLRNHNIGKYLSSRKFKLFMNSIGAYENWKDVFDQVEASRSYFSVGMDHESADAADTLGEYFNNTRENKFIENLITKIIENFIENTNEKTDFSDILESARMAKFSALNLIQIQTAINTHENRLFPQKIIKPTKMKVAESETKKITEKQKRNIFIVHGHNEEIKLNVARTLEKLGLNPIILNEQSNEGLTIIEKFEKHSDVSFAIVLLTFDDFGNSKSKSQQNKRARQNVVLELGYFIAKLGRKNVLPLYENEVELPSDMAGILYTVIDDSENWKLRLIKELKTAGFKIDANDII